MKKRNNKKMQLVLNLLARAIYTHTLTHIDINTISCDVARYATGKIIYNMYIFIAQNNTNNVLMRNVLFIYALFA